MSRISRAPARGLGRGRPSPTSPDGSASQSRGSSEVLHLPLPAIREIVAADPVAWRYFGLAAVAHNDTAIGAADDLLIRDHVKRSVAVLLRLGGCRYGTPRGTRPIEVDVSQDDFATMTNMARTTAGTVLRKLEAEGSVKVSYRRVRILEPDALRKVLEP